MNEFLKHIKEGLSQKPKKLSSRYFYDEKGDELFQQIMKMKSYYLPDCEMDIIKNESNNIAREIAGAHKHLQIVELGAGDGSKTKHFLDSFESHFESLEFVAMDISPSVLNTNKLAIKNAVPDIEYKSVAGNYFETFKELNNAQTSRLTLLLGANIGNYSKEDAVDLFRFVQTNMEVHDYFLVAFDLVKHPRKIMDAYDDKQGITKAFNLNLLDRINRELGADFKLEKFDHFPFYNPTTAETHSCIISLEKQKVTLPDQTVFHFDAYEAIHTEISKKYFIHEIENLANESHLSSSQIYFDTQKEYAFVLFKRK